MILTPPILVPSMSLFLYLDWNINHHKYLNLIYVAICRYVDMTKSRNKHDNTTTLHHYKADVFNVAIDQQLVELNDRFSVQSTELLTLCVSLNPLHDIFDVTKICTLAEKFYPADFSNQNLTRLESQLIHFRMDVLLELGSRIKGLSKMSMLPHLFIL